MGMSFRIKIITTWCCFLVCANASVVATEQPPTPLQPARVSCNAAFSVPCARHNSQYLALKTAREILESNASNLAEYINDWITVKNAANMDVGFYPFVVDRNTSVCIAHGANPVHVGKTLEEIFESAGIGFSDTSALHRRFVSAAEKGGDWVQYLWNYQTTPVATEIRSKLAFVTNLTDQYYIGVGYENRPLPEDLPCTDKLDAFCSRTNVRSLVGKAQFKLYQAESLETLEAVFYQISFDAEEYTIPQGFYLFMYDYSGPLVAHARLHSRFGQDLGQVVSELKLGDVQDGIDLHNQFVQASQGVNDGWVQYQWRNPSDESSYTKIAFVVPIHFQGKSYYIGAGFNYARETLPDGPSGQSCSAKYNAPCAFRTTLQIASHALSHTISSPLPIQQVLVDLQDSMDFKSDDGTFYVFAYDFNGTCVSHGQVSENVGMKLWELLDKNNLAIDGHQLNQQFVEAAEEGGGWVLYNWVVPGVADSEFEKVSYIFRFNLEGRSYYGGIGFNHERYPVQPNAPGLRSDRKRNVACTKAFNLTCSDINARALLGEALVELTLAASPRQARVTPSDNGSSSGELADVLMDINGRRTDVYSVNDFDVMVFATDPEDGDCEDDDSGCCVAHGGNPQFVGLTWQQILDEQQITSVRGRDLHNSLVRTANLDGSFYVYPWSGIFGQATTKKAWVARFRRSNDSPSFYVMSEYMLSPQPPTCDECPSNMECTFDEQEYCTIKPSPKSHEEYLFLIIIISVGIPLLALGWWYQRRRARLRNEEALHQKDEKLQSMAKEMEQMRGMVKVVHDMHLTSPSDYEQKMHSISPRADSQGVWYWEEDEGHLESHKSSMVLKGSSFVRYAREVSDRIERDYQRWAEGRGFAEVVLDLTKKIESTKSGTKVRNSETGFSYVVDFERMTQRNVKSKYERTVRREEIQLHVVSEILSDLPELPDDIDFSDEGEDLLPTFVGQVIQVTKVHQNNKWLYGNVLYDPLVSEAMKQQPQRDASSALRDTLASVLYDRPTSGWFPRVLSEPADVNVLQDLVKTLGSGGLDTLKPPAHWDPNGQGRLKVSDGTHEHMEVVDFFTKALKNEASKVEVVSVERVQNLPLWQSYSVKKQAMKTRDSKHPTHVVNNSGPLERKWLFHGTSSEVIPKIVTQGFNRAFAGRNAVRYGIGVYFARDSAYSSHKTYSAPDRKKVQRMFLCRVAVGDYCVGKDGQLTPDSKPHNSLELFDSTVDTLFNPAVFVVYHDAQAYPEYIIAFKRKG